MAKKKAKKKVAKKANGRPPKYKPEYDQALIDFCSQPTFEEKEIPHYKNGEIAWIDYKTVPKPLPTMVQFAKHIGVGYRTVFDWLDSKHSSFHESFSRAYLRVCKDLQKDGIIQGGLMGVYNPLFAKFTAVNMTDMRDKNETTVEAGDKLQNFLESLDD